MYAISRLIMDTTMIQWEMKAEERVWFLPACTYWIHPPYAANRCVGLEYPSAAEGLCHSSDFRSSTPAAASEHRVLRRSEHPSTATDCSRQVSYASLQISTNI